MTRLLKPAEVCERLGAISRSTLQDIVNRGELAYVRIGRRGLRFEETEILRYIARRRESGMKKPEIGVDGANCAPGVAYFLRQAGKVETRREGLTIFAAGAWWRARTRVAG